MLGMKEYKSKENNTQWRQKQASILKELPISQTPQHAACATNVRQQQSQVVTAHKENHIHVDDDGNNSDSSKDLNEAEKKIHCSAFIALKFKPNHH
jgi:hypothetical protein